MARHIPSLLLVLLFGAALALSLPACGRGEGPATPPEAGADEIPATPPAVDAAWRGQGADVELSVWRMHCEGCEGAVEQEVSRIPGVTSVKADRHTCLVQVRLADASRREALIPEIRKAVHAAEKQILGEDAIAGDPGPSR